MDGNGRETMEKEEERKRPRYRPEREQDQTLVTFDRNLSSGWRSGNNNHSMVIANRNQKKHFLTQPIFSRNLFSSNQIFFVDFGFLIVGTGQELEYCFKNCSNVKEIRQMDDS